jgi:hypothetical protein
MRHYRRYDRVMLLLPQAIQAVERVIGVEDDLIPTSAPIYEYHDD